VLSCIVHTHVQVTAACDRLAAVTLGNLAAAGRSLPLSLLPVATRLTAAGRDRLTAAVRNLAPRFATYHPCRRRQTLPDRRLQNSRWAPSSTRV
jgi:hypothetical protein